MDETHASDPGLSGYFDDEGNYYAEDGQVYPPGYFADAGGELAGADHEPQPPVASAIEGRLVDGRADELAVAIGALKREASLVLVGGTEADHADVVAGVQQLFTLGAIGGHEEAQIAEIHFAALAGGSPKEQFDVLIDISASGNVHLFIDDLLRLVDITTPPALQDALEQGRLRLIVGASPADYQSLIAPNGQLSRYFEPVFIGGKA